MTSGLAYGESGQRLDVYRPVTAPQASPTVLLWHGSGPDERDVLAPLARATAALGTVCFVPDWRPDTHDHGRTHLRESAAFVRRHTDDYGGDSGRITLAGWSLGARAAVAAALDPRALDGWRPRAVVAIAGGYTDPEPLTGRAPMDELLDKTLDEVPVLLIHGTADTVEDIQHSRRLHAALRQRGRPTSLDEPPTDHAGIIMTVYDPEAARCLPSDQDHAVRAAHRAARLLHDPCGALTRT
ncbi:alpha/beta hydrolase [Streptomyces sp. NPDC086787]|uniref:alpha/beta hydrolase n=1 Tax=Streptomyces sp. NPDC086787 TaxID=3365759 RepID=UPI00381EB271